MPPLLCLYGARGGLHNLTSAWQKSGLNQQTKEGDRVGISRPYIGPFKIFLPPVDSRKAHLSLEREGVGGVILLD